MLNLTASIARKLTAAVAAGLLLASGPALAQDVSRALQSIDFVALDGNRVQLTMTLSEPAPEPVVFTIDKPARLSLDFPETRVTLAERFKKINIGNARSVATAEAKNRTRVVVELTQLTPYTVRVEGNKVVLQIDGAPGGSTALGTTSMMSASSGMAGAAGSTAIRDIDFRRGEKGEGRIVVRLGDPRTPVDVREEGGRVIASFKNAQLPENLSRRMDVLDFATPVKFIDARRDGINTELAVTPVAGIDFEQVGYQTGDVFTLELQPLTPEKVEERRKTQPQWTGERISLSFQNVDIRSLLQIIADVAGTNMVVSDSVRGEIAMRLQNVPWDQALDIILRTKGLGMRQQGNVMLVAPLEELAVRERAEMEQEKQKTELAPLRSELIQVNYARASEMAALLRTKDSSILSDRGRISVDDRTNTLIVLETREKLAEVRDLITRLDIPVRQVLIESRIVIANDDYARELGTRFGVATTGQVGNTRVGQAGTNQGSELLAGVRTVGANPAANVPSLADRYLVNLPASANAASIAWTLLGSDFLIDLELSALQSEGRGEVISTPRVITANGKEAMVEQGVEIPYLEATSSGAASVKFKKAVLSLITTPQITPDDRVILDLAVTNDTRGEDIATSLGGSVPSIDKRALSTQVLVKSGETIVLGGVFQHSSRLNNTKVPLLGDIPLIGALFRNDARETQKRELLIFVTPKVIQEGLRVQ